MIGKAYTAGLIGADGYEITVECDILPQLQKFEMVGLPDTAVKEAKERVRSACLNSGYPFPDSTVVMNLAPADKKKEGSAYDLAMLMALLCALDADGAREISDYSFIGELSLSGDIRPVNGVLCRVLAAKKSGKKAVFVAAENANEAAVVDGIEVYGVPTVRKLLDHLRGISPIEKSEFHPEDFRSQTYSCPFDFSEVKGQEHAKRAMEVAAAGGHNILLIGPPGTGKSMLAKRLPGILPPMTFEEAVETTKIHSVAGLLPPNTSLVKVRPFRAPHHTATTVSLSGGGSGFVRPGEVSLAHNGVLFLDELPEYAKSVTDILRQPLEDRRITVTRMAGSVTYPSFVTLVCAMNPCKCGYYGHPTKPCTCTEQARQNYLGRVSGPLLDRIDLQIEVSSLTYDEISDTTPAESSAEIRERVIRARKIAEERFRAASEPITCNAQMSAAQVRKYCVPDDEGALALRVAYDRLHLSGRGHDRLLKVARTIADLAGSADIQAMHILEAITLRTLDREDY